MDKFKPKQLLVVVLWAEDVLKTAHFYRDIVGLEMLPHHAESPTFVVGEGVHLLIKQGKPTPAGDADPFPLIAFQVEDLEKAIVHLESNGIMPASGVVTSTQARYVVFYDPAGNLIEFAEMLA